MRGRRYPRPEPAGGGVHLPRVRLHTDVGGTARGEGVGEVSRAAAHVEDRASGQGGPRDTAPQVVDHHCGVLRQRAVEPGGIALLEAEL